MTTRAVPVPLIAPGILTGEIQNGVAVSSRQWSSMAAALNYCLGRGSTQVPAYYPGNTIAAGSTATYHFRVCGTTAILTRLWVVRARSASATQLCEIAVTAGSDTVTAAFTNARNESPILLVETIASPTAEAAVTLDIEATSGLASAIIDHIACYDLPRASLEPGLAKSVNASSVLASTLIYDDGASAGNSTRSVQAVVDALRVHQSTSATPNPKRNHWQWSVPSADAEVVTSGSFVTFADNIHYLPKRILTGSSSTSLRVWLYALVDTGNATIKLRSGGTDLDVTTISSTTGAWVSFDYEIGVQENITEPDGRADISGTPVWSALNLQGRVNTATQLDVLAAAIMDNN